MQIFLFNIKSVLHTFWQHFYACVEWTINLKVNTYVFVCTYPVHVPYIYELGFKLAHVHCDKHCPHEWLVEQPGF